MARASRVVEDGPTSVLPTGLMLTQRSHGKMDNMKSGMVTATTSGLELDMLQLRLKMKSLKMRSKSFSKMKILPLHFWLWLSVTMTRHQLKGWMNLQVLLSNSLWATWLPAPTRGRAKARESLLGKASSRVKVKASMSLGPNFLLRTESRD